jgi:hypothetical protein
MFGVLFYNNYSVTIVKFNRPKKGLTEKNCYFSETHLCSRSGPTEYKSLLNLEFLRSLKP